MFLTILIFAGLLITMIVKIINKCAGAIVGLILTIFVLCVGLDAYKTEGWNISFFDIEISKNIFLIFIGIWLIFDIIGLFSCKKKK